MRGFLSRLSWFGVATVVPAAISFIALPFLTLRLDPAHYGAFALGAAVGNVVPMLAGIGAVNSLSSSAGTDRALLTAGFLSALVIGFLAALVIGSTLAVVGHDWLPGPLLWLSLAAGALSGAWTVGADYLVARGRARPYAAVAIGQAALTPTATGIWLLAGLDDMAALFVGWLAGALFSCIATVALLAPSLTLRIGRDDFRRVRGVGGPMTLSNVLEWTGTLAERWLINVAASASAVGLFVHSQQYRNLANTALKVLVRSNWSVSVAEARESPSTFRKSAPVWEAIDMGLIGAGLGLALVGREAIDLLTHGKFGSAAPLAAAWIVILLVQNATRPAAFVLIGNDRAAWLGRIAIVAQLAFLALVLAGTGTLGVWMPVYARLAAALITWAGNAVAASRLHAHAARQRWLFPGVALIVATATLTETASLPFSWRLALFALLSGGLVSMAVIRARTHLRLLDGAG